MKTNVRTRLNRFAFAFCTLLAASAWGQTAPPAAPGAQAPRGNAAQEKRDEKVDAARDKIQAARDSARDARETARDTGREDRRDTRDTREQTGDKVRDAREQAGDKIRDARENARDTARDDRQTTRDARENARDTISDDRQAIRGARREGLAARREFLVDRIRSGDFGLFVRRLTNGLQVSGMSDRGAITQSGLKEGDEILAVNGQAVSSERDFVDHLFADHHSNKPAQVKIKRNGQEQTIAIQTKPFIDEHLAGNDQLHEFGLVLDESDQSHVKVQTVLPRSPAFYAGMRSGDEITRFNGQRIAAVKDLIQTVASLSGGTTPVEVNRNGAPRELDVHLPGENGSDPARTALKPVLPGTSQPAPQQPQANPAGSRPALPQQPRPNAPR